MNRFLVRLGSFGLILAFANGLSFWLVWSNYLSEYYPPQERLQSFNAYLFADSHGLPLGKKTEKWGLFNFSSASDTYGDIYRKLKFLLSIGKPPLLVVLTADDHTLSPYRDRINNFDRSIAYADLASSYSSGSLRFFEEKYIRYYFPLLNPKDRDLIRLFFIGQIRKLRTGKPNPETGNWSRNRNKTKESHLRADWQFPSRQVSEIQKNHLINILKLCKSHQIRVMGLKFPLSADYQRALNGRSYRADSVILKFGFPVADYSHVQWPDSLFENQDHLNSLGGAELMKGLEDDLPDPENGQKPSIFNPRSF